MILARLSRAIREQNWLAVAIEFVIVIAGVVIGFQISAWASERQAAAAAKQLEGFGIHAAIVRGRSRRGKAAPPRDGAGSRARGEHGADRHEQEQVGVDPGDADLGGQADLQDRGDRHDQHPADEGSPVGHGRRAAGPVTAAAST